MISAEQVGERYLTVHHRMRRAVDDGMTDCGLSLARTKVLGYLRHGPTRPSVLAAALGVAPHTITDVVDALERDHAFLLKGDVFTEELLRTYVDYKRTKEVDAIRQRPHPYEFALYYDI